MKSFSVASSLQPQAGMPFLETDVIVVGAGSAGAVIAGRLAMQSDLRIILLESGGSDAHPIYRVPLMTGALSQSVKRTWRRDLETDSHTAHRKLVWPQGNVVGGSSAINGMVWMRGRPSDYDGWARQTSEDWAWDSVRQVFDKLEGVGQPTGAPHVRVNTHMGGSPLYSAFVEAVEQAGNPVTLNMNAPPFEGGGRFAVNVDGGQRWSAARAFLDPARHRPNLRVSLRSRALKLIISGGRSQGVMARIAGRDTLIFAPQTVLCAGAVNSPLLLLQAGVGPRDHLADFDIECASNLPGVGQNLQDHFCAPVAFDCAEPVSLHRHTHVDRAARAFLQSWLLGRGPASLSPFGAGFVLRSSERADEPDLEGVFVPARSTAKLRGPSFLSRGEQGAFTCAVYPLRPKSRGRILLRSAAPETPPIIQANYLSDPSDRALTRLGVKLVRDIISQSAFDPFRGNELAPGASVASDDELDRYIAESANTAFHPCGSCKMGPQSDPLAVVSPRLQVHGIKGLRVADASIMPTVTSGNTNAPSMMIGYRCADFILDELKP